MSNHVLQAQEWHELREAHRTIVLPWIRPRLERRSLQQSHPVDDFLFEYYPISTNKLLIWHPGFGFTLQATESDFEEFPVGSYEYSSKQIQIRPDWLSKNKTKAIELVEFLQKTRCIHGLCTFLPFQHLQKNSEISSWLEPQLLAKSKEHPRANHDRESLVPC